ncbi:DUF2635 domain-containing protein [Pseudogulbenkiania ferrooxidans]|uniref:DUF2635 domain-containing protein n=1 Tax=Pseudogulbenkiania ferrooxidans EGD-HP2 TaxID=1388764 RepID=A0ABN0N912_9NEIS|nr:DUF2635 domain-containing protein [Pseudogulbenkiania ferrooxidans]ERE11460.1 hypothetical protein O166_05150 [Pseudogulbenkiania ferrooxidans EGD-HP2]
MNVKAAAPGLQVPKEDNPRAYITDAEAVDVPRSAYYLRVLGDGDLVEVDEAAVKTNAKKGDDDGQR